MGFKITLVTSAIVLVFCVSAAASFTESLLRIPLFEVGNLWTRSFSNVWLGIVDFFTSWPDFSNVTTYIILLACAVFSYYFYQTFFTHMNRVRYLGDVGYLADGKMSMKDISNSVRKRRMVGTIPPVYPNGWFGLIEAHRLKKGETTNLSVLGKYQAIVYTNN